MESRDLLDVTRRKPMSNLQAIADRFEIEALRGEFTDAGMMRAYDRLASLFTQDGVADPRRQRRVRQPGGDPRRDRAAAGPLGLLRANHAPTHDPA
jgi:hypothetical protein